MKLTGVLVAVGLAGICGWMAAESRAVDAPSATAAGGGTVHSIELPEVAANWPEGPGREIAEVNCAVCHSSRYITMQPKFSRKVWEAEVEKMRKTFGAPIPEENVKKIVDYLMAVRGAGEAAK